MKKFDDYENVNNVNPLYLIIGKADGYKQWKQYLVFISTDGNKKASKKFTKLWDEIKHLIKTINWCKKGEYEKHFMKKFESDDNRPLTKILKPYILTVIVWLIFRKDGKYYPQVF